MPYFLRLLGLSCFQRDDFSESGMKYNILSAQMWPSWVFGSFQFQIGRDPRKSMGPKGESMAPKGESMGPKGEMSKIASTRHTKCLTEI